MLILLFGNNGRRQLDQASGVIGDSQKQGRYGVGPETIKIFGQRPRLPHRGRYFFGQSQFGELREFLQEPEQRPRFYVYSPRSHR
jgi:hypothetical protein